MEINISVGIKSYPIAMDYVIHESKYISLFVILAQLPTVSFLIQWLSTRGTLKIILFQHPRYRQEVLLLDQDAQNLNQPGLQHLLHVSYLFV